MSGLEWIVEAHGCNPAALRDQRRLEQLFEDLVRHLNLHPLGKTNWHQFPHTGGITGVSLLAESHIACHTFPEYGSLCLNIFCCRPRESADFDTLLKKQLGAARIAVRQVERPYQP